MTKLQQELDEFLQEKNYVSPWLFSNNTINPLFARASSIISVKKNQYLYRQGEHSDAIFIVRTGRFRVFYLDHSGTEKCIYIVERGSMLGEVTAFDPCGNCVSSIAITDATLYRLNIQDFHRLTSSHPEVSMEVIQSVNHKVRLLCSEMEFSSKPSASRVAASLLALCIRYGKEQPDGSIQIPIRFTHEELANLNNLNRVTVSKMYQIMQSDHMIANVGGYITVLNARRLMDYVK